MNQLKAVFKLLFAVLHIASGFVTVLWVFPRLSHEQRQIRVQAWSRGMLRRMGIELVVKGNPYLPGPLMLVANHISWLDITSLHAARFCRFVSKADVAHWPLIGRLATGIGTLYLERASRRDAMRVVHHMASSLREGDVLGVFPEGTTSDGSKPLQFHANLFEAAIVANAPVQPVALRFMHRSTGEISSAPRFIHDDTLMGSVWRTLVTPGITVMITFGELQWAEGRDRRTWAAALQQEVVSLRDQLHFPS